MTKEQRKGLELAKKIANGELSRLQVLRYDTAVLKWAYTKLNHWNKFQVEELKRENK